jgi:ribonuclease P protein component
MLNPRNRLKIKRRNTLRFTRKIIDSEFIVRLKGVSGPFKAAIVVSKKTAPKAVDRNRIKRLVATALKELKIDNLEMVITVRENIAGQKMNDVKKSLESFFKKYGA